MHSSLAADSSRPFCCPAIARQRSQFQPRAPEPAIRLFRKSPACLLLLRSSIRARRHFMPELPRGTRSHDSQRPISLRPLRDSPRPSDLNICVRERKKPENHFSGSVAQFCSKQAASHSQHPTGVGIPSPCRSLHLQLHTLQPFCRNVDLHIRDRGT